MKLILINSYQVSSSDGNGSTFEQLDDYSLMDIFDHLQYGDLLNLAASSPRFYTLVYDGYFKGRMASSTVVIDKYGRNAKPSDLIITDYTHAIKTLEQFGGLIKMLRFDEYMFNGHESEKILQHIAQYTSNTLTELSLFAASSEHGFPLTSTTNYTFPHVTSLHLRAIIFLDNFQLERIYPNLNRLKIELRGGYHELSSLERRFNNLQHVDFGFGDKRYDDTADREVINAFSIFAMNPQLESVALDVFPTRGLLEAMNNTLPNLNTLSIRYTLIDYQRTHVDRQPIYLGNVRTLHMEYPHNPWSYEDLVSFPINFDRLREVEYKTRHLSEEPTRLFEQNEHLKVLSLPTIIAYGIPKLLRISEHFRELEVFTVNWSAEISEADTLQLMNIGRLTQITFIVKEKDKQMLKSIVPLVWTPMEEWFADGKINLTYKRTN